MFPSHLIFQYLDLDGSCCRFQTRDIGSYQWAPNSRMGANLANGGQLQPVLEPPRRPASFANMEELNQYLEDLKKYYALLGRPR